MAKIRCRTLEGGLISSNRYKTPKGNEYLFEKAAPTEISDKEDIAYFLKCGNGELFESVGAVKDAVKETVEKVKEAAEKVKEKVKEKVTGEKTEEKTEEKPGVKKHTYTQLKDKTKREQTELLQRLGGSNTRIPRLEEERIKAIMKLEENLKG